MGFNLSRIGAVLLVCVASASFFGCKKQKPLPTTDGTKQTPVDAVLLEGEGVAAFKIGQTTAADVTAVFGDAVTSARADSKNGTALRIKPLTLDFVPDEAGTQRLYAVTSMPFGMFTPGDQFVGKTSSGITLLESETEVVAKLGAPGATWRMTQAKVLFYPHGLLVRLQHVSHLKGDALTAVSKAVGKTPSDGPGDLVVSGLRVTAPFTVTRDGRPAMGTPLAVSTPPETDLLVSGEF